MSEAQHVQLLALAPPGAAFPREADSVWGRVLRPLANEHGRVEAAADALRAEVDPGAAPQLIEDYERVLGEDPCLGPASALPAELRGSVARQRWTARGGSTPAFFVGLAASLGLDVEIVESVPFECGVSQCGDELVPGYGRFEWIVRLIGARLVTEDGDPIVDENGNQLRAEPPLGLLTDFEAGATAVGSALGELPRQDVLECVIRRHAPAHTAVFFSYGA